MIVKYVFKAFLASFGIFVILANGFGQAAALVSRGKAATSILRAAVASQSGALASLSVLNQNYGDIQPKMAFSTQADGPLAKIYLLNGQFVSVKPECKDHTLLHGAMLCELGLLKSLYTLLISPKIEILDDGRERLVPDYSFSPLGRLLQQFFYLAGGTLAPTKRTSSCVYNLKPADLGRLYRAAINQQITLDFDPLLKSVGGGKSKKAEYDETRNLLMNTLLACQNSNQADIKEIYPAVIRAYFWAKCVTSADSAKIAQEHIDAFCLASGDLLDLVNIEVARAKLNTESSCINHLLDLYSNNLPKPPMQGAVKLSSGHSFPDCGESGIRAFFNAAFYHQDSSSFVIPAEQASWYDAQLVGYYAKYPSLAVQSTQEARNAWGEVISNRANIVYGNGNICDLNCRFSNVMALMVQLVPGICEKLDPGIPKKDLLTKLAQAHGLIVTNFSQDETDLLLDQASWHLHKGRLAGCNLYYKTYRGHMVCELHSKEEQRDCINDRLLGCVSVLDCLPKEPDKISPLLFAAARMAKHQDYASGYLALLPSLEQGDFRQVTGNIKAWGLLTPESQNLLRLTDDQELIRAMNNGFDLAAKKIVELYESKKLFIEKKDGDFYLFRKNDVYAGAREYVLGVSETVLLRMAANPAVDPKIIKEIASRYSRLGGIRNALGDRFYASSAICDCEDLNTAKLLLEHGADPNGGYEDDGPVLYKAAFDKRNPELVKLLIKHGAKIPKNMLHHMANSHASIGRVRAKCDPWLIDILLENGIKVDARAKSGKTALHYICSNHGYYRHQSDSHSLKVRANILLSMQKLLTHGANINIKDKDGNAPLDCVDGYERQKITLLLEYGATVTQASFDRFDVRMQGEVLDVLLTKGLPLPELKGHSLDQRLEQACTNGQAATAKLMLERGARTAIYNKLLSKSYAEPVYDHVLYLAALLGHTNVAKILLDYGLNVEEGHKTCTPLHAACISDEDHVEMVTLLLDHGADINQKAFEENMLTRACNRRNIKIAQLLIERGIAEIPKFEDYSDYEVRELLKKHQKPILKRTQQAINNVLGKGHTDSIYAWAKTAAWSMFWQLKSKIWGL